MKYSQRVVVEANSGRNWSRDLLNEGLWFLHLLSLVGLYYHCECLKEGRYDGHDFKRRAYIHVFRNGIASGVNWLFRS